MTIKIKTPVKKITYILPISIMKLPVTNEETGEEEIKEVQIAGFPQFDPLELTITDELDSKKWINSVYSKRIRTPKHPSYYKKNLEVEDTRGNVYELYGCFPTNVSWDTNTITIIFDSFVVKEF